MLSLTRLLTKASFASNIRKTAIVNSQPKRSSKSYLNRTSSLTAQIHLFTVQKNSQVRKRQNLTGCTAIPNPVRCFSSSRSIQNPTPGNNAATAPSTPARRGLMYLEIWEASDVKTWALEQFLTETDANILANNVQKFKSWILHRDDTAWTDLEQKLNRDGFKQVLTLKERGQKLQNRRQTMIQAEPPGLTMLQIPRDSAHTLTNPTAMEAALNSFLSIPSQFGTNTKGYSSENKFFVSQQRLDIWKRYYEVATDPQRKMYMVPSGPHGIGKSGVGLMLAVTAYHLKKPLFYYPNCRTTLTQAEAIKTFYLWNQDLFDSDPNVQRVWDTLLSDNTTALTSFWTEFTALPGAVVILDEHNEFYRQPIYQVGYALYTSFQHFAAAQLVVFIGSAHSAFENRIPDGYRGSLTYLQPLSKEELQHFINAPDSPVRLLPWPKVPGNTPEEKFEAIYNIFGGVFRLIVELCVQLRETQASYMSAIVNLRSTYKSRLDQTLAQLDPAARQQFVTLLKAMQNTRSTTLSIRSDLVSAIYDRGILYVTPDNLLTAVNGAAMDAINLLGFEQTEHVLDVKEVAALGYRLEAALINSFSWGGKRQFTGFYIMRAAKKGAVRQLVRSTQILECNVIERMMVQDNDQWSAASSHWPIVIVPDISNFRDWDVIVKKPEELFLFQVTMAKSGPKLRQKFNRFKNFAFAKRGNTIQPGDRFVQYAKNLYGDSATVIIESNHCYIRVPVQQTTNNQQNASYDVIVHFILVHGYNEVDVIEYLKSISSLDEEWKYLLILAREELVAQFDIKF